MITDKLIELPYYFLSFVIGLLPRSEGFPPTVLEAASSIGEKIGIFEPVMPVATLSACLGVLFAAQLGVWSWKSFKWIVGHIPYIGGRG